MTPEDKDIVVTSRLNFEATLERAAKAEAQCAEMREALQPTLQFLRAVYEWCVTDCPSDIDGDAAKAELARLEKLLR